MFNRLFIIGQTTLLMLLLIPQASLAGSNTANVKKTKTIYGVITNIKLEKPYPFFSKKWECKIRISWDEKEEDGDIDHYVYKAYPVINAKRSNRYMCFLPTGLSVKSEVEYTDNSPMRGKIITLEPWSVPW